MKTFELSEPFALVNGKNLTNLHVTSTLELPWRMATIQSDALSGQVQCTAGYKGKGSWTVFEGQVDSPESDVQQYGHALARGLPEWRKILTPQSFQDPDLQTVLQFIAARCGGKLQTALKGARRRHYSYRAGTAYQILTKVLQDWAMDHVLIELDGGVLYAGPEQTSPHAQVGIQAELVYGQNIVLLKRTYGGELTIKTLGMPWLRLSHRVQIEHPLFSGKARIIRLDSESGKNTTTEMTVIPL